MVKYDPIDEFHEKYWFWLLIAGIVAFFTGILLGTLYHRSGWWMWALIVAGIIMIIISSFWGASEINTYKINDCVCY
jgi:hypothetical protein